MAVRVARRGATFNQDFPHGIKMVLRRLEPWEFDAVSANATRAAAQLRDGGAAITKYGFDEAEFSALADPAMWEGMARFIYAVELGLMAIKSMDGIVSSSDGADAPVEVGPVSHAFRLQEVREMFLAVMEREGSLHHAVAAEGNG